MKRFNVYIYTNNAAFEPGEKPYEVAAILRKIASIIEDEGEVPEIYRSVYDINGNTVGRFAEKEVEE